MSNMLHELLLPHLIFPPTLDILISFYNVFIHFKISNISWFEPNELRTWQFIYYQFYIMSTSFILLYFVMSYFLFLSEKNAPLHINPLHQLYFIATPLLSRYRYVSTKLNNAETGPRVYFSNNYCKIF